MLTPLCLFTGGRLESVDVLSGAPADVNANFDPTYSDAALQLYPADVARHFLYDASMTPTTIAAGHTAYFHTYWRFDNDPFHDPTQYPWQIFDDTGYQWFRFLYAGGALSCEVQETVGAWTAIGSAALGGVYEGALDFVVKIDAGGAHHAALYRDGVVTTINAAFAAAGFANVASVRYSGTNNFYGAKASQMMVTQDLSTVGAHVKTTRATGAGAHSAWTGAYTDVNEVGDNDATNNSASADALAQSYPMGNIAVTAGYYVETVFHWLRGKNTAGDPGNIKSLVRSGGADTVSGDLAGIGLGYGAIGERYDTDPNTAARWIQTGWNAPVELGFVSAP